jgi:hypothetical protein
MPSIGSIGKKRQKNGKNYVKKLAFSTKQSRPKAKLGMENDIFVLFSSLLPDNGEESGKFILNLKNHRHQKDICLLTDI